MEFPGLVSFDMDSTLACTRGRWHLIKPDGTTDWKQYTLASASDTPGPALPMAQYLSAIGAPFVVVSARDKAGLQLTRDWLTANGVHPWGIFLSDGSQGELGHGVWKAHKLLEVEKLYNRKIIAHFDDWTDVAIETAKVGINTILVHDTMARFVDERLA